MAEINCTTPKDNLKVIPCLACLSESELKKLLIVVLAELTNVYTLPGDTGTLLQDAACYGCMSKKQLLQIAVTVWATIAYGSRSEIPSVDTLREKIKCLLCATPGQVDAALAQLTCGLIAWSEA